MEILMKYNIKIYSFNNKTKSRLSIMVSNNKISWEIPCTVLKAWAAGCQTVRMDSFRIRLILSKIRNF